jgi:hypothetical protein
MLTQASTGISWSSIPPGGARAGVTDEMRLAVQGTICAAATALVDERCHQPLRATIDTLEIYAPGARSLIPRDARRPATLLTTRWPVLSVVSIGISPNAFPRSFTPVADGMYAPKYPVVGMYGSVAPASAGEGGNAISVAAGYLHHRAGREAFLVQVEYINGWPHTSLTAPATATATTVEVDDCTGWAITSTVGDVVGATGTVYDPGGQEVIQVESASAAAGPGTLTLAAPLGSDHNAGVMVSTLPQSVVWATILYACDIALQRGATATTVQEAPGKQVAAAAGVATKGNETPSMWADKILAPYARII